MDGTQGQFERALLEQLAVVPSEHQKNGRPVEGEGWSGGAEEGRGREPPELCARQV